MTRNRTVRSFARMVYRHVLKHTIENNANPPEVRPSTAFGISLFGATEGQSSAKRSLILFLASYRCWLAELNVFSIEAMEIHSCIFLDFFRGFPQENYYQPLLKLSSHLH